MSDSSAVVSGIAIVAAVILGSVFMNLNHSTAIEVARERTKQACLAAGHVFDEKGACK